MIISIINQEHNIIFRYHLNTQGFELLLIPRIELATHVDHYKHRKQEKKIHNVSP